MHNGTEKRREMSRGKIVFKESTFIVKKGKARKEKIWRESGRGGGGWRGKIEFGQVFHSEIPFNRSVQSPPPRTNNSRIEFYKLGVNTSKEQKIICWQGVERKIAQI